MARRAPRREAHPAQYSVGGTWYPRWGKKGIWTRDSTNDASEGTGYTGDTAVNEKRQADRTGASTIMSLQRGGDDASPAIAYRNRFEID